MILHKSSIKYFTISILYKLLLDLSYILFVNDRFAYYGFNLDFDWLYYTSAFAFTLIAIHATPRFIKSPSDFFLQVTLFSFLIPFLSYGGLSSSSLIYQSFIVASFLMIATLSKSRLAFPYIKLNSNYLWAIAFISVAIVTANFLQPSSLKYMNFDLNKVYDFRDLAAEVTNQGFFAYLNKWTFKSIGPLLIIYALYKRHYTMAIAFMALHVFWFSVSGHKSVLFYPFISLFIFIIFDNSLHKKVGIIPLALSGVVLVSLALFLFFDYSFIASLFIRRVFFTPAHLSFEYYNFFTENGFLFWSYKIPLITDYPYDLVPARVIGEYLGNSETNANSSFFSTGYMNAGLLGIVIYGLVFSSILMILNKLYHSGVPLWIVVSVTMHPIHSIIKSSDMITGLITHGLGITLIILYLLSPYFYKRNLA